MSQTSLTNRVFQDPTYFIAFGFGSGLMPVAPGTWGTLAAVPLYLLIGQSHWLIAFAFIVFAFVIGVKVSDTVSQDLGVHDYKGIVWDEVVGYLLTMLAAPHGIRWMVLGFILFRLFDIWKPQPIRYIDQKVSGGLGIMLDDVLAAVPAWLIIQLLAWSFVR
jgi:phosphatidylglycerophosphatase A